MTGSNRRHPACKAGALPAELIAHFILVTPWEGASIIVTIFIFVTPTGRGLRTVLLFYFGDPYGIRTRVTAVKGRCLRPLDQGANFLV